MLSNLRIETFKVGIICHRHQIYICRLFYFGPNENQVPKLRTFCVKFKNPAWLCVRFRSFPFGFAFTLASLLEPSVWLPIDIQFQIWHHLHFQNLRWNSCNYLILKTRDGLKVFTSEDSYPLLEAFQKPVFEVVPECRNQKVFLTSNLGFTVCFRTFQGGRFRR